jgi:hypothetical protein
MKAMWRMGSTLELRRGVCQTMSPDRPPHRNGSLPEIGRVKYPILPYPLSSR